MAIKKYEKDGKTFWQAYVGLRSTKVHGIRLQKRITGIESERQARIEEKRLVREISEEIAKEESRGSTWGQVVERWISQQQLFPTGHLSKTTLIDYEALLRNWTSQWWNKPAAE